MPRESAIPIDLPSLDDLFTTQAERDEVGCEKVGVIPLYMIDPFPDHPFRVDDDALRDMAESVSRFGVLVPALVRPKENGRYEMVSGHRRKRAAEMAGLEALPAVVREMTYDEAVIAMVDANIQRENVLPSEKAFAYKMKIDALSRQGYRSDLTWCPSGAQVGQRTLARHCGGTIGGEQKPSTALRPPHAPQPRSARHGGRRVDGHAPRRGDQLSVRKGAGRPARRHGDGGVHAVPRPGDQDAQALGAGRAVARSHGVHHGRAQTQPGGTVPHPPREDRAFLQARHEQGGRGGPHSQGARALRAPREEARRER